MDILKSFRLIWIVCIELYYYFVCFCFVLFYISFYYIYIYKLVVYILFVFEMNRLHWHSGSIVLLFCFCFRKSIVFFSETYDLLFVTKFVLTLTDVPNHITNNNRFCNLIVVKRSNLIMRIHSLAFVVISGHLHLCWRIFDCWNFSNNHHPISAMILYIKTLYRPTCYRKSITLDQKSYYNCISKSSTQQNQVVNTISIFEQ